MIDLIGEKFGRLAVIDKAYVKEVGKDKKKRQYWKCQCECGNIVCVDTGHLRSGHTQSCGCYMKQRIKDTHFKNLIGQKFDKLTVIEEAPGNNRAKWLCKCDCGNTTIVSTKNLSSGNTSSCGCKRAETMLAKRKRNKYDFSHEYGICYSNSNEKDYFIFDLEDYEKIKDCTWSKNSSGHWVFRTYNECMFLTHVIMPEVSKKQIIDHVDRNPDNNRKNNLRASNKIFNAQNSNISKRNTTGYVGVSKFKGESKWRAYITVQGKQFSLGNYRTLYEAVKARLAGEKKYFEDGYEPQRHLFKEYGIE